MCNKERPQLRKNEWHLERQVTPETDRGIASLKHHKIDKGDQYGKNAIRKPCEHV